MIVYLLNKFNKQININDYDVFLSPVFSLPDILMNNTKIQAYQILYDCVPLLKDVPFMEMDSIFWFKRLMQNFNKSTYYFCISDSTKNDFLKFAGEQLDKSKMLVTPIASSQNFYPKYDRNGVNNIFKKYNYILSENECYCFSLCTIEPRKNLVFTIKCFINFIKKHKINNLYFLLGGGHFEFYYEKFIKEISQFTDYQDKIIQLGYVDDEDINILLSNSIFFVYLSQYEGFGMPPLEAMQAGAPVICSNNSSLPEVVGDSAITIQYDDEAACIKAMEDLYFNEALRKEYILKGIERGKQFSWEKTFNQMNEIIMNSLSEK